MGQNSTEYEWVAEHESRTESHDLNLMDVQTGHPLSVPYCYYS